MSLRLAQQQLGKKRTDHTHTACVASSLVFLALRLAFWLDLARLRVLRALHGRNFLGVALALTVFVGVWGGVSAQAADISNVQLSSPGRGVTRIVLSGARELPVNAFALSDPARFVVDYLSSLSSPNLNWSKLRNVGGVKSVRAGVFKPGVVRIVFEMTQPMFINKTSLLNENDNKARYVFELTQRTSASVSASGLTVYQSPQWRNKEQNKQATFSTGVKEPSTFKIDLTNQPIVMIDPGHGGVDPGALNKGLKLREKDINLQVAKELKKQLEEKGFKVMMTRDNDRFIRLRERFKVAERQGASLFISLHADAHDSPKVSGMSIYVASDVATDKEARRLEQQENRADLLSGLGFANFDDDLISNILIDIQQQETRKNSILLAGEMVQNIGKVGKTLRNSVRFGNFAVLKSAVVPSVLVEMGYLSNPYEAKNLMQSSYRRALAQQIAVSVRQYFDELQSLEKR